MSRKNIHCYPLHLDFYFHTLIPCTIDRFEKGCLDSDACNFTQFDQCIYSEENFNCNGDCLVEIDCVGACGGDVQFCQNHWDRIDISQRLL